MKRTLLFTALFSWTVNAAETDQFYAIDAEIKDSTHLINDYYAAKFDEALNQMNKKTKDVSCEEVSHKVMGLIVGENAPLVFIQNRSIGLLSVYTQKSPLFDRYPDDSVKESEYRKNSIYENRPIFYNLVSNGRTININGIHIGTDKVGHFSIVGRTYFKNYRKYIGKGIEPSKAEIKAILDGLNEEKNFLGYAIGGSFSFGDLEANFRGLQFGKDICESNNPYLIKVDGKWSKNPERSFDFKYYVNPKFDESYNVTFWSKNLWKRISPKAIPAYCKAKQNPNQIKRLEYYQTIMPVPTINDTTIAEFIKKNGNFDRSSQLYSEGLSCK